MAQPPLPSKVVTNPRIAKLIELEVAGRIKPEHQQELDTYRAMGLAPKKAAGALTESQSKSSGFYERAAGANSDFEKTQAATNPRGLIAQGLADAFPGTANTLSSSDRQVSERAKQDFIAASLRYESGAAIGKDEYTRQDQIFFPQPGDSPEVIAQKAQARQRVIDGLKVASGPGAAQVPAGAPAKQETPPAALPGQTPPSGPIDPNGEGDIGFNQTETPRSPFSPDQQKAYDAFLSANPKATADQLRAFGSAIGVNIDNADDIVKGRDANGGRVAPGSSAVFKARDVGGFEAGALAAGDAATAGLLPKAGAVVDAVGAKLDGDTRPFGDLYDAAAGANEATIANAAKDHPYATIAGSVVGGVPVALGGSLGLARALPRLGALGAGLISDAAYGGVYGANRNRNNPVLGALTGAGVGLAGSAIGGGGAALTGRALSPTGGTLAPLYAEGVRPTLGQRFGGLANWAEQNAGSIPIVGGAVRGARQQARDQFERGAFNQALREIGTELPADIELGTAPHAFAQQAFDDAYTQARQGMQFVPDAQYAADRAAFDARVGNGLLSADQADRVNRIVDNVVDSRLTAQGGAGLTGDAYMQASSELGRMSRALARTDPVMADALNDYVGIFDGAARRASSPDAVAALDAADRGYAQMVRIENAAAARGGDTGRFSPTQFDRAVQRDSGGVRSRAYLRGDALMGDYAEAGKALVDTVPNSGTPERAMAAAVLTGGAGYISPPALALPAAIGVAYAPGVRDVVAGSLAPRRAGSFAGTLGDWLRAREAVSAPLAGAALTAPASSLLLGNGQ